MCPICSIPWRKDVNSIQCDSCNKWIHAVKCSKLTHTEFNILSNNNNDWFCQLCTSLMLPFNTIDGNEIYLLNNTQVNPDLDMTINDDVNIIPKIELKKFINECKLLKFDFSNSLDKDNERFPCPINSNYYDISDLNKLKLNSSSSLRHDAYQYCIFK